MVLLIIKATFLCGQKPAGSLTTPTANRLCPKRSGEVY